jgi:hypothetical protein
MAGEYQGTLLPQRQSLNGGFAAGANPDTGPGGTQAADPTNGGKQTIVQAGTGAVQGAQNWWKGNVEDPVHKFVGNIPVIGGIDQMINGTGSFQPLATGMTDAAATDANNVRNGFVNQYSNLTGSTGPVMNGARIDTTQSDQSRNMATGGFSPMGAGLSTQQQGAALQQQGVGTQNEGIGVQRGALGALGMGLGAQQQGLGAQQTGMGTLGDAASSYRGVLSGATPSVAALTAQKLQGQNVGSMFGGAASARGVDRAGALRAAITGAGAVNAMGAADASINQAREQDAARQGLAGIGGAQVGAGSAMAGTGSSMGGIGQGIAGVGQGITSGGQGISATGAGLANTGAGMVNTGTAIGNLGMGIRGQDQTGANNQSTLDQATQLNNLNSQLTTNGQNITQQNNLGTLALGAQKNEQEAANAALEQQRKSAEQGQKNSKGVIGAIGSVLGSIF